MSVNAPVLMPMWMIVVAVAGLILVAAWLLRSLLVTRRDQSREVGDIPMAPSERGQWVERVETAARRFTAGETDLRGLHLGGARLRRRSQRRGHHHRHGARNPGHVCHDRPG